MLFYFVYISEAMGQTGRFQLGAQARPMNSKRTVRNALICELFELFDVQQVKTLFILIHLQYLDNGNLTKAFIFYIIEVLPFATVKISMLFQCVQHRQRGHVKIRVLFRLFEHRTAQTVRIRMLFKLY